MHQAVIKDHYRRTAPGSEGQARIQFDRRGAALANVFTGSTRLLPCGNVKCNRIVAVAVAQLLGLSGILAAKRETIVQMIYEKVEVSKARAEEILSQCDGTESLEQFNFYVSQRFPPHGPVLTAA
jgi:hypothetical protein